MVTDLLTSFKRSGRIIKIQPSLSGRAKGQSHVETNPERVTFQIAIPLHTQNFIFTPLLKYLRNLRLMGYFVGITANLLNTSVQPSELKQKKESPQK